jgi:predicted DNA-binding protein (MmcQ/YjbR family)
MTPTAPDPRSLEGTLRGWALAYPGATEDFPWGERAIKVGGKVFLFLRGEANTVSFSVKLPHSAAEALEESYIEPTHYGLGKHGWVTATVDTGREAPLERFRGWIEESFRSVAPKLAIAELDGAGSSPARKGVVKKTPRKNTAAKKAAAKKNTKRKK